ncbi:MAG TPA: nucleotidyltransferase domain-containing protein [Patescibacteria group bacterium]|nr:nucleotidyltransferase domain-containing protein [Patescibacteria group bacterium]
MQPEQTIQAVRDIVASQLPPNYTVVLFGSWAKGNARPTSDIDIGIVGDQPVSHEIMVQIRKQIDSLPTLRKIDVVDLQTVSARFKEHALKQAQTV